MSDHEAKPCPNCGHCPTCGHTPQRLTPYVPWPYVPTYPYTYPTMTPYWMVQQPYVTSGYLKVIDNTNVTVAPPTWTLTTSANVGQS